MGLIFLIAFPLLLLGIIMICGKWLVNLGKIMVSLGVTILTIFAVAVSVILVSFSTVNSPFYSFIICVLGILAVIFTVCALWGLLKRKAVYVPLCVSLCLCIVAGAGFFSYQRYIESIATVTEGDNLFYTYAPYAEDTKVVSLDEEPSLKISENLPRLDGATALYPIYSAFAKAVYPKELLSDVATGKENEYLKCTTTTTAYEKIVTGEADIIFVAGPSEEQEQFAKDNGVELVYTPIGREAFVFFVNAKNPIEDITMEQIQKIYSGEFTDWSELGVSNLGKIKAFQRDKGSGSQSALERIMAGKTLMTPPTEDVIDAMSGIIERTADYKNFKNAIGYSFRFYSTQMVKNSEIKLLSINGVYPDIENIENGTYPIASYFYAVTRKDDTENTKEMVDWILSDEGQRIIEMTGYTPLN